MPRKITSVHGQSSIEEPLIGRQMSNQSVSPSETKTMLCVVSIMSYWYFQIVGAISVHYGHTWSYCVSLFQVFALIFFLNVSNLQLEKSNSPEKQNQGTVVLVGRKLLQVKEVIVLHIWIIGVNFEQIKYKLFSLVLSDMSNNFICLFTMICSFSGCLPLDNKQSSINFNLWRFLRWSRPY